MMKARIQKIGSSILILIGAMALISEIASGIKNYYVQSIGLVCLMTGIFLISKKVASKAERKEENFVITEEEKDEDKH